MFADEGADQRDLQTFAIIGACMAVHSELGPGFLESVYQEALAIEFTRRGIPFVREQSLPIDYAGVRLITHFEADFICYDEVVVELNALAALNSAHHAITINYLKATSHERGLLVNFGASRLEYKRIILSPHLRKSASSADKSVISADDADVRR
ncbi:MAG: GxxExxY protein [Pirellulales bacterium]|nr:GxxExxY protein [Pirellulales bacterium]